MFCFFPSEGNYCKIIILLLNYCCACFLASCKSVRDNVDVLKRAEKIHFDWERRKQIRDVRRKKFGKMKKKTERRSGKLLVAFQGCRESIEQGHIERDEIEEAPIEGRTMIREICGYSYQSVLPIPSLPLSHPLSPSLSIIVLLLFFRRRYHKSSAN